MNHIRQIPTRVGIRILLLLTSFLSTVKESIVHGMNRIPVRDILNIVGFLSGVLIVGWVLLSIAIYGPFIISNLGP